MLNFETRGRLLTPGTEGKTFVLGSLWPFFIAAMGSEYIPEAAACHLAAVLETPADSGHGLRLWASHAPILHEWP